MNILFLTLTTIFSIEQAGIYTDLIRSLSDENHVYAVSIHPDADADVPRILESGNITVFNLHLDSARGESSRVKKGVSTLLFGYRLKSRLKKLLKDITLDLIVYATPPVSLGPIVAYFKKRDSARTYLLLKDIFPQNSVDLGMMSKSGVKGVIYRYFRNREKELYRLSDRIGCMSEANVAYLIKHNSELAPSCVEVCPNSTEIRDMRLSQEERARLREQYGLPRDKRIFVYGGNLGKPQGIPFILECLRNLTSVQNAFFLIAGDGSERSKLERWFDKNKPDHMRLLHRLPKERFDRLVGACDVGLVFLDHRFTIPNFPSRILPYMQAGIPVLACTDCATDVGAVITGGGFGWWCESERPEAFVETVKTVLDTEDLSIYGERGWDYLCANYDVRISRDIIVAHSGKCSLADRNQKGM